MLLLDAKSITDFKRETTDQIGEGYHIEITRGSKQLEVSA